jgi:hypothetical protein
MGFKITPDSSRVILSYCLLLNPDWTHYNLFVRLLFDAYLSNHPPTFASLYAIGGWYMSLVPPPPIIRYAALFVHIALLSC